MLDVDTLIKVAGKINDIAGQEIDIAADMLLKYVDKFKEFPHPLLKKSIKAHFRALIIKLLEQDKIILKKRTD